jgi:5-formyltetrahydrofolate cyclo-ligase
MIPEVSDMSNAMQTEWSGHHEAKDRLRSQVWTALTAQGAAVGEPVGHIPRFVGAEQAAERLAALPCWRQAKVIKCNPDRAQEPVRLRALQDDKQLYMAVPRLTKPRCFVALEAHALAQQGVGPTVAATNRGAMRYGRLVAFEEMRPIDLVVVGCVAVSRDGGRTGKGAGFADLELGLLRQFGLVQADTPVVTTVHAVQIVAEQQLPMLTHDWSLTWIVTPDETVATQPTRTQPTGIAWDQIRPEQWRTIPALRVLRPQG